MQPTSGTPTLEYDSALYLRYPRGNSQISTLIVHTIITHLKRQRHSALLDTLAEAALGVERGGPFVVALTELSFPRFPELAPAESSTALCVGSLAVVATVVG